MGALDAGRCSIPGCGGGGAASGTISVDTGILLAPRPPLRKPAAASTSCVFTFARIARTTACTAGDVSRGILRSSPGTGTLSRWGIGLLGWGSRQETADGRSGSGLITRAVGGGSLLVGGSIGSAGIGIWVLVFIRSRSLASAASGLLGEPLMKRVLLSTFRSAAPMANPPLLVSGPAMERGLPSKASDLALGLVASCDTGADDLDSPGAWPAVPAGCSWLPCTDPWLWLAGFGAAAVTLVSPGESSVVGLDRGSRLELLLVCDVTCLPTLSPGLMGRSASANELLRC